MYSIFSFLLLGTYLSICYQDFKSREVYLLTYAVLYAIFTIAIMTLQYPLNLDIIIINVCILGSVVCLLLIYYLLRYQGLYINRLKYSIGWGDVLMLPAFVLLFTPGNLIFVFVFSLVLSLIFYVVSLSFTLQIKTIPLAGIQSLVLSIILFADFIGVIKMQVDFFPFFQ